jgi:aspartyl-tRNA synthetase
VIEVTIRARVHNVRVQSAKLAFLDLRQRTENIQAVIAEGGELAISRAMVKWCGGLNRESIVLVTGLVKAPKDSIHLAIISYLELHVAKVFVVSEGPVQLLMRVKDAMHPPPTGDEADAEGQVDSSGTPIVTLNTRLNNRVLSLRTPTDQTIFRINGAVCELFREYLIKQQFQELQTPKIAGAATEGGAGVFEINYFNSPAFLTQSPQFYKQMAIAGDMERVFEIGPVFRAENSNTPRHLTEARLLLRCFDSLLMVKALLT